MSQTTTIARPYAKAIFEHAVATNKLSEWSFILHILAMPLMDEDVKQFIANPASTGQQHVALLMAPFVNRANGNEIQVIENLVSLLSNNKRLTALPDIHALFERLRAEQEKMLVVFVRSFSALSAQQQEQLKEMLSKRLNRAVTLNIEIDKSLIGGAVIQAGDLVIDGSVRERLNKLRTGLAA